MNGVGIIAGAGVLPLFVAHEALNRGHRVVVIAFPGFTDPQMEQVVRETFWLKLGQLERAISVLKAHAIDRVVMAGKIEKINLLRLWNLRPDLRALRLIRSMEDWRDDTVLAAIAAELSSEGIVVDEITQWAERLMAPCGVLSKRPPNDQQWRDIEFGRGMAQGIGALDIGQTVVVKNAAVLVAEGLEGTDKAIRRAADFGIPNGVVVKMAKPEQDMRFDVPGVGTSTIDSMIAAKANALAVEAGKTLIADFNDMIRKADEAKISVVGIPPDGPVR